MLLNSRQYAGPATPGIERPTRSGYRPDIDGIRCIAIIGVVLFHTGLHFLPGGFVGVDVFFVISGYLVGSHVFREARSRTFSFRRFYSERIKRIVPAAMLVLLVSSILACLLLSARELSQYASQVLASLTCSSNFYYWLNSKYFDATAEQRPLLMMWSLGVEEQFYCVLPFMLLLIRPIRMRYQLLLLVLLSLLSFGASIVEYPRAPNSVFYLLPFRAWELGIGCLLGIVRLHRVASLPSSRVPHMGDEFIAFAGLAAVLLSFAFLESGSPAVGLPALIPVIGTAVLLCTEHTWINRYVLAAPPMVTIGLISYSFYLWHWPLLSFMSLANGGVLSNSLSVAIILFALLLSLITYMTVEQPCRQIQTSDKRVLVAFGSCTAVMGSIALLLIASHGWPSRYRRANAIESVVYTGFPDECLANYHVRAPLLGRNCLPAPNGRSVLALMGDSHASALAYGLNQLTNQHGWGFYELTKSSCPQLSTVTRAMASSRIHAEECREYNAAAMTRVLQDPAVKGVILAGYWSAPFSRHSGDGYMLRGEVTGYSADRSWANFTYGLDETVRRFKDQGKSVFIVIDTPRFTQDPFLITLTRLIPARELLQRIGTPSGPVLGSASRRAAVNDEDMHATQVIKEIAAREQVHVVDSVDALCDSVYCRYALADQSLYLDTQHLSALGSQIVLKASLSPDVLWNMISRR